MSRLSDQKVKNKDLLHTSFEFDILRMKVKNLLKGVFHIKGRLLPLGKVLLKWTVSPSEVPFF